MSMHELQEKAAFKPLAVLLATFAAGAGAPLASGAQVDLFAYDSPTEITAGKGVAESACARCHGLDGIGKASAVVPHLAGQRPAYLYERLLAHKAGATGGAAMHQAVRYLSESALKQAAAYYANVEPPKVAGEPPAFLDPVQAGREAAAACAGCHGADGNSAIPGTPRLSGLHPGYLAAAIKAYRDGGRQHAMMAPMVAGLADADIDNLALFYGRQKPSQTTAKAITGAELAAACGGCHGKTGNSAKADIPSLAGPGSEVPRRRDQGLPER